MSHSGEGCRGVIGGLIWLCDISSPASAAPLRTHTHTHCWPAPQTAVPLLLSHTPRRSSRFIIISMSITFSLKGVLVGWAPPDLSNEVDNLPRNCQLITSNELYIMLFMFCTGFRNAELIYIYIYNNSNNNKKYFKLNKNEKIRHP